MLRIAGAGLGRRAVHSAAAEGYTVDVTHTYERGRPEYGAASVRELLRRCRVPHEGGAVLEVGSGTGKFTRAMLAERPALRVTAAEPVEAMRLKFAAQVGAGVDLLAAPADDLPLPAASFDAVVAAQAFHWFATPQTLVEFHRVLRPGGAVGLLWNSRDAEAAPWVARLEELVTGLYPDDVPRQQSRQWMRAFEDAEARPLFGPLQRWSSTLLQPGGTQMVVDRVLSLSVVGALGAEEQARVEADVRALLDDCGVSGPELQLPYRTDVFWAVALPAPTAPCP